MGRLLHIWHRLECWIAVLAFSFIALVLCLDVLGRELYGPLLKLLGQPVGATGLLGSQKKAVFALVIGSFGGIATATGVHLVPRVGFKWLPQAWSTVSPTSSPAAFCSAWPGMGWSSCWRPNSRACWPR